MLQVVALASGPLILVQPLLAAGLLFALPVSVLLDSRRPSLIEWSWAALLVGGLAVFLITASPGAGPALPDDGRLQSWWLAGAPSRRRLPSSEGDRVGDIAPQCSVSPPDRLRGRGVPDEVHCRVVPARLVRACDDLARLRPAGRWHRGDRLQPGCLSGGPSRRCTAAVVITDSIVAIIASAAAFHEDISTDALAIAFQVFGFLIMALAIVALARQAVGRDARSPTATPPG